MNYLLVVQVFVRSPRFVRNTCRTPGAGTEAPTFEVLTTPSAAQARALDLIRAIRL